MILYQAEVPNPAPVSEEFTLAEEFSQSISEKRGELPIARLGLFVFFLSLDKGRSF